MQALATWFNDPLIQSVVISPLVGAVLGVLFAGLNNAPSSNTSLTVQQTTIIFNQTIIVNKNGQISSASGDAWGCIFALVAIVAGVTWGYSRYAPEILGYWLSGLFSCSAFIFSAGVTSAIRGQYSSTEWAWYIFTPFIAVGISFYLLHLAESGILPGAREAAQKHNFFEFYFKVLKEEHRMWLLFQIMGVLLGVISALAATLRSIHYLALMNQRSTGGLPAIWYFLARSTYFSARSGGVFLMLIAMLTSYLMLSGNIYEFWRNKGYPFT